jgi:hypothetical protein
MGQGNANQLVNDLGWRGTSPADMDDLLAFHWYICDLAVAHSTSDAHVCTISSYCDLGSLST